MRTVSQDNISNSYPVTWRGLLNLKSEEAAVQLHYVWGNLKIARDYLPRSCDGDAPFLKITQRIKLEPTHVYLIDRKMQFEPDYCILLALPCSHEDTDVSEQSQKLQTRFLQYLSDKRAAGVVVLSSTEQESQPEYVAHIFSSCDFANEHLERIAPNLLDRVSNMTHLIIIITKY